MVITKIGTFIENKYFKKSGIEDGIEDGIDDDLKQMKTTLLEILATMAVVEKQRIVDPNQVQLVRQIKDAVYDAEDCMHEFDYYLLEEKSEKSQEKEKSEKSQRKEKSVESQEKEKSEKSQQKEKSAKSKQNMVRRAASWIIPKMCRNTEVKDVIESLNLPKRTAMCLKTEVKEVMKSLDLAKRSADKLQQLMDTKIALNKQFPEQYNQPLTSPVISEEIIGRETECDNLIDLLFEKVAGPPTVIPIVGQGGIGKTTLAQMVFNDPRVTTTKHFDETIWLTVSDNFDMLKLTKEMLKHICPNFSTENVGFGMVQRKLETELKTKKILLILDDVWYGKDDDKKSSYEQVWLQFLAPLKNAEEGSKIIVTTREDSVVRSLASFGSIRPISLEGLNDDDGWSLLKLKAFDGGNPDNLNDLEPIGKMIVSKLKGSALAIRVIGMELKGKSDKGEWERILNEHLLDKTDIMEILLRSYQHLPDHLQRCFAYCSLFPKDYRLKRNRLVHMWIAQGFVRPHDGNISEQSGQSYFNELIARSFIQVIKRGNKEYYVMHDLMNDLACHVSQGECYRLEEGDTLENLGSIRHLSVTIYTELDGHKWDIPETTWRELEHLIKDICGLDKLRTLIFLSRTGVSAEINGEFSIKLKRIRVLDIEWCFRKLPIVGECKHLHYLCFRCCYELLAHDAFSKLYLLTVLFIRASKAWRNVLVTLCKNICNMSRLEFIETSKSIDMQLDGRVQLHSLWRGGSAFFVVDKKKGWELGHLGDFNNIKDRLIICGLEDVASKEAAIKAQLDSKKHVTALSLHWGSYSNFSNKHNEIFEALKPNPSLEHLSICGYPGDKFPSWLESNWLSRMTNIFIAGGTSGFKTLPALGQLSQLKRVVLSGLTTVSRISDEFYGNGTFPSLEELRFDSMKGLEEWSSPSGVQSFPKLRILELVRCPDLFSIPEMESSCSLQYVQIQSCPEIRSLPKLHVSLKELNISGVHHDLKEQIGNKIGQEWDKVAAVSGCRCAIRIIDTWYVLHKPDMRLLIFFLFSICTTFYYAAIYILVRITTHYIDAGSRFKRAYQDGTIELS